MKVHAHADNLESIAALAEALGFIVEVLDTGQTKDEVKIEVDEHGTHADTLKTVLDTVGYTVEVTCGDAERDYNRLRSKTISRHNLSAWTIAAVDAIVRQDFSVLDMINISDATRDRCIAHAYSTVSQREIDAQRKAWDRTPDGKARSKERRS